MSRVWRTVRKWLPFDVELLSDWEKLLWREVSMEIYLACIFSDVQKCGRLNIHLTFGGKLDKIIYLRGGGQYLCELRETAEGNATS